jgi:uncharacterized membrane protein YGL010W
MIGVPLIVASLPTVVWNWRVGLAMFVIGWTMQFAGHRYFERNRPVLMADPKNPLTYMAALIFVVEEWLLGVQRVVGAILRACRSTSCAGCRQGTVEDS